MNMSPQLRRVASVGCGRRRTERKDFDMPQMFDWIFFAIVGLPLAYIVWDWLKDR